jgi:hypothetical protein
LAWEMKSVRKFSAGFKVLIQGADNVIERTKIVNEGG